MEPRDELKRVITTLHDKYHPQAIFMTQTSSTLYGWSIKEAWKKAYPSERLPTILTINTRTIQDKYNELDFEKHIDQKNKFASQSQDYSLPEFKKIQE